MEPELEKIVGNLNFFWDRRGHHRIQSKLLKDLDNTNYVFNDYAADGYHKQWFAEFQKLTDYLEEQDDGRSVYNVLCDYDNLLFTRRDIHAGA